MDALKQIANIAGQPGLYRILKPSRTGVIVETLDQKKEKTMMGPTARVSVLNDISVYVDRADESIPLGEVFRTMYEKYGDTLPVTAKSDNPDLVDFFADAIPDYDRERVRSTDIKKIVSWYGILRTHAPEAFEQSTPDDATTSDESAPDETTAKTDA